MSDNDQVAEPVGYGAATQIIQFEVPLADLSFIESLAQRLGWKQHSRKVDETEYIMSSAVMVERIKQAEKDVEDGKGLKIKLKDLID